MSDAIQIRCLQTIGDREIEELSNVLTDCVEGGASVSFMLPMSRAKAEAFWHNIADSAARGERMVLAAHDETGSIVGTAKTAREFKFKPDEWNRYQITAAGDHIVVVLNGETTLDIHDSKFSEGNLRLQYQKFPIMFRNIKVRALP